MGLSDQPHHLRRGGRLVATGVTIGVRAATGQPRFTDAYRTALDSLRTRGPRATVEALVRGPLG